MHSVPGRTRLTNRHCSSVLRFPAQVACRQVGLPSTAGDVQAGTLSQSPVSSLPPLLANLSCTGSEASLLDCPHTLLGPEVTTCEQLTAMCFTYSTPGTKLPSSWMAAWFFHAAR